MKPQTYKIVFCTPALYSAGGVERMVSCKANYFSEVLGHEVAIILTEGKERKPFFPLSERIKVINLGLDFEQLWNAPFWRKAALYIRKQRRYKQLLTAELTRLQPDITISTLRREINFLADIDDGSAKIGELHLNRKNFRMFDNQRRNVLLRLFECWWKDNLIGHLRKLDRFVVLTENSAQEWPELDNVAMIPDFVPITPKTTEKSHEKRVVSIGRYSYEKGYDLLLEAWALVEKQFADWRLDIYGMGDRSAYERLAERLGIDRSRCRLNSSVEDVSAAYQSCSIFALSSRFEGFGLVLVEAMASEVPVIAFNCPNGPTELIDDGINGLLVPASSVKVYAEKLAMLMRDETLRKRLGSNGREKAVQHYTIERIAAQWEQLFDELMKAR